MKILFWATVIVFLVWVGWVVSRSQEVALWPHVQGEIVSTKLDIQYRPNLANTEEKQRWYGAQVEYEYTIGDKRYTASRVSLADKETRRPQPALDVINRYRKQWQPQVYYNPKDPREALLERWGLADPFILFLGVSLLTIWGLIIYLFEDPKNREKKYLSEIPKLIFRDKYGNLIRS